MGFPIFMNAMETLESMSAARKKSATWRIGKRAHADIFGDDLGFRQLYRFLRKKRAKIFDCFLIHCFIQF
jgi:hypothetical protein